MSELKQLYRLGDPSESAYVVKSGTLHVSTPYLETQSFNLPNILVGVLELFLEEEHRMPNRLFDLAVDAESEVSPVGFATVLEMTEKYEFGYSTNKLLAILIEATNTALQMKRVKAPEEWNAFEEKADCFNRVLKKIELLWKETGIGDYKRLIDKKKYTQLYRDGQIFEKEKLFSKVDLSPTPIVEYLQKIPKDEIICKKGDSADCLYVLLSGSVGVISGGNFVATINEAGEAFGELSILLGGKRTAGLVTMEDSAIYIIDKSQIPLFHTTHPKMFIQIARTLAKRVERNLRNLKLLYSETSGTDRNASLTRRNINAAEEIKTLIEELKGFKRLTSGAELNKVLEDIMKEERVIAELYKSS